MSSLHPGRVGHKKLIPQPTLLPNPSVTPVHTQTLTFSFPRPTQVPYPCSALNTDVQCLLFLAGEADGEKMGHNRVVQLPAKSFTLNMLWEAAQAVAKEEGIAIGTIKQVAPAGGTTTVKEINVCPEVDISKARALGMPTDVDAKDIIRDYVKTYIKKA